MTRTATTKQKKELQPTTTVAEPSADLMNKARAALIESSVRDDLVNTARARIREGRDDVTSDVVAADLFRHLETERANRLSEAEG